MASRTRSNGPNQDDLFNPEVELLLPARLVIDGKVWTAPDLPEGGLFND